jgi:hypothetical protein
MPVERRKVKLFNLKESAEVLGLSHKTIKTTLRRAHQRATTGHKRTGHIVKITETEFKKFIESDGGSGTKPSQRMRWLKGVVSL